MTHITQTCGCGRFEARLQNVEPSEGNRVVCYCDDCQAFQHWLGQADRFLDADGGSDLFQTTPAHYLITHGHERLAAVRLTPKGVLRWYAGCCRTPIANTLATRQVPMVSLFVGTVRCDRLDGDLPSVLGAVDLRVFARHAHHRPDGDRVFDTVKMPPKLWWPLFGRFLKARLRGEHKLSPFFRKTDGSPLVEPRRIDATALGELRRRIHESRAEP